MSDDYRKVREALETGADPAMVCMTCPWDRFCVNPPTMTRDDVEQRIDEARRKDEERARQAEAEGKEKGLPMGSLMTAITLGGRAESASVCPVFALRLRSSQGKDVVDMLKRHMQGEQ